MSSQVKCSRPWRNLLVTTNGDCYHCCHQGLPLGNLNRQTFQEVWNGQVAQQTRQDFLDGKIPKACERGVGLCQELGRE